ncbi:major facilitator superfamily domain-containing protein 12-like isoform X2 [Strongylocentrotus purpuratus]|uniref:Major facilitator superfamily domain-containing protein 12-like n=1 Tax=Strongylocentrotus purpuratus TaxID=7668 RepID=A0A7M7NAN4_STRPU|nr:major facilitator superfamily domain-containing protein 12-like isoform X2 [Strongylocentrotus purpuratus]
MEEDTPLITTVVTPKRLPFSQRLSYGVGHVLNDLCASMWFSYLLVYFHKVLGFSNSMAGALLLLGQISDGLCTPLIGYESDHTKTGICNYGRRKSWHLIGTLSVICSFTFIYQPVFGGEHAEDWARFIYYAPFVVIFQFGWAATQISHLSLIPEITSEDGERVELNAIRYAFTVMSSILVYLVTYLLLQLDDQDDMSAPTSTLDPDDIPKFRYLVIIVVSVGTIFSIIFHLGTKEPKGGRRYSQEEDEGGHYGSTQATNQPQVMMKWSDWLKESQFYQVTALYMFTRLMVNIAQIYIPMYVTDTLNLNKNSVALVPLVVYISGFLSTLVAKPINKKAGRKMTYLIGAVVYIGSCVWMAIPNIGLQVYGAAILLGAGGSTVLVTSLAFTADLIGRNTESGAFVYGAMSFTDKISNGIAVEVIQLMQPCVHCCPGCKAYYKEVMTYVTGGSAICAIIVLATLIPVTIGKRRKKVANSCKTDDRPSLKPEPSRPVSSDFFSDSARSHDEDPAGDNGYLPQSDCGDVHAGLDRQAARICGKQVDQEDSLEEHHWRPKVELNNCAKAQSQEDLNQGHGVENNADPVLSEGENYSQHEIRT